MGIFDRLRQLATVRFGRIITRGGRVRVDWDKSAAYTSSYLNSIYNRYATDMSKSDFKPIQYNVVEGGSDIRTYMKGSAIDEVLNVQSNGALNNKRFWFDIFKELAKGNNVYLQPIWDSQPNQSPQLMRLEVADFPTRETINLTSFFDIQQNQTLLDTALSNIADRLSVGGRGVKGAMRINANIATNTEDFKNKAKAALQAFDEIGQYNGLTVLDNKTEIHEFKNEYSVISPEEAKLIQDEILNQYGFSEAILKGTATIEEQRAYNQMLANHLQMVARELTLKLYTPYIRRKTEGKQLYRAIEVDNNLLQNAPLEQIIQVAQLNLNAPYFTWNEIRQLLGADPVVDGDVFLTNLNSVQLTPEQIITGGTDAEETT